MEASLFKRVKDGMVPFNIPEWLDIPLGQYVEANGDLTQFDPPPVYPRKTGPNYALIAKWMVAIEKIKPHTRERWRAATNLLRYMGYSVTWEDDTIQPTVHWFNTEGNGDIEAAMINDIMNRDYTLEPKVNVTELDGNVFYANMREILKTGDTRTVFTVDSFSEESTDPT